MRKPIIAGNWKMNMTPSQGAALINEMKPLVADAKCDVVVCVPYVDIPAAAEALKGSNIGLGAQNMNFEPKGAFTGEISADMLKELGVQYVIIGHSERRAYYAETDETVNKKVKAALDAGFTPIVCVGESLEQREAGGWEKLIADQAKAALDGVCPMCVTKVVIAYEPIWAIGTGKTASDEQANEAIAIIRKAVSEVYGEKAEELRIQYGGSMNAKNAQGLMAQEQIDGGLIGGASLKAPDFSVIVAAASATVK
ncbi:MAG: triose-phosphate isomerase [Clostridiales bacterium]|nr:triose-phosphate isomerase [Clostridiales bacterium]MBQ2816910.1 triose-phosphate isomerase [Clostridia bacterium]